MHSYNYYYVKQLLSLIYGFISTYFIVVVAIYVLGIVSKWIIFVKARQGGWKSLIPIYCDYTEYKVFWSSKVFFFQIFSMIIGPAMIYLGTKQTSSFVVTIGTLMIVVAAISRYVQNYKKAKFFRQSAAFAIGMYFFPYIFNLVLVFDKNCKHDFGWWD